MNYRLGEHAFNINDVCDRCGMTRKQYEDRRQPRCPGQRPPPAKDDPPILIED
jgi:hypothetical protein